MKDKTTIRRPSGLEFTPVKFMKWVRKWRADFEYRYYKQHPSARFFGATIWGDSPEHLKKKVESFLEIKLNHGEFSIVEKEMSK